MRDDTVRLALASAGPATERPISIAIVAMGGQGGGVLTDWIVTLAESQGWVAQSTSVPGVAQRTGATIYYVETMPPRGGRNPILSMMPTPGDVDVVIASEFMEAGRSILRGIVTPDRTTLIASNHRSLAITEKMAPGEGIADSGAVREAIGVTAKREIVFDMDALATQNGSVISSAMFGALAGAGVLPFERAQFEAVVRASGKGVTASLKTFEAAFHTAQAADAIPLPGDTLQEAPPPMPGDEAPKPPVLAQYRGLLPDVAGPMVLAGLRKVIDYQDENYGREYLDILTRVHAADRDSGGADKDFAFTVTAAKYLANAMVYDDVIRVADLKTRAGRRLRIEREMGLKGGQVLHTTEFMHPRLEEVVGTLPTTLGRWLMARPRLFRWLEKGVNKGRRVRTYTLPWFLALYVVAGLRGMRRRSLRHGIETAHRDAWLEAAISALRKNYKLGIEVLRCRRLIKGYSDTHARGLSKFDKVLNAVQMIQDRGDAADWARRMLDAAVKDPTGDLLDGTIKTIKTFV